MKSKVSYIDTNVFLRFLVEDRVNPTLSEKARKIFFRIKKGKISVQTNVCVVSELVYVLEGHYRQSKDEVFEKIVTILSLDNINIENKGLILSALFVYKDKNVDFEDAYSYTLMKENQIDEIYTFDKKHFTRFNDIRNKS